MHKFITNSGFNTVHTDNHVSDEFVKRVIKEVEATGGCEVSFDVTGRTLHEILSQTLKRQFRAAGHDYHISIDGYDTVISK